MPPVHVSSERSEPFSSPGTSPFRQATEAQKGPSRGLGLGLSIVRHIVTEHAGRIEAVSAGAGKGATFVVRLPVITETAAVPHPPPSAAPSLSGVRVLVVEDDADTRAFMAEILERHGAAVTTAGSAEEALAARGDDGPGVLVSDIALPGDDGYALLERLRARGGGGRGRVPALAVTAYASSESRAHALAAGYGRYLAKPLEAADLASAVLELASSASAGASS